MKCLTFRNQFEDRIELEGEMLVHSKECSDCAAFAREERSLSGFLSELPKYDSPVDFGVSVRSRIAGKRPGRSLVWSFARFAIPTAAMLLIIGFVVFNSDYVQLFPGKDSSVAVQTEAVDTVPADETAAGSNRAVLTEPADETDRDGDKVDSPASQSKTEVIAENKPEKGSDDGGTQRKDTGPRDGGGTIDSTEEAFEEADVANPPGLDPDRKVRGGKSGRDEQFTSGEILAALGLNTVWKSGRLFVVSVSKNSVGQKAGVRRGDQIVSIDGRAVSRSVAARRRVSGQVLKVRRDGIEMQFRIAASTN